MQSESYKLYKYADMELVVFLYKVSFAVSRMSMKSGS